MSEYLEKGFLGLCQLYADALTFKDVRPTFGTFGIYVQFDTVALLITTSMISSAKSASTIDGHMMNIGFEKTHLTGDELAISRIRFYFDHMICYDFYSKDGEAGTISFRYEGNNIYEHRLVGSTCKAIDQSGDKGDILNIMVEITEFLRQAFVLEFNQ